MLPIAVLLAALTIYFEPIGEYRADKLVFRLTFYRIFSLGAGALIALYEPQIRSYSKGVLQTLIACLLAALVILSLARFVDPQWVQLIKLVGFGLFSVFIVISCILAEKFSPMLKQLLCVTPLLYFGKISYGLYLYHLPIFYFLGVYHYNLDKPPTWLTTITALTLSIIAAAISYQFIEKPILKLKDKIS